MADLPLLRKAAADPRLASSSPDLECSDGSLESSDMFFSSGQGVSGMLPTVRPIHVRAL
jgi:hypothetical protein